MAIIRHVVLCALVLFPCIAPASDWPVYMGNNSRTGVTQEKVEFSEKPLWIYSVGKPSRGFYPELKKTKGPQWIKARTSVFDYAPSPVVHGDRVYIPSSTRQSVISLSAESGGKQWEFFTSGAVRFAPAVTAEGIVFGSDDGFVYCLGADGKLKWKFQASPENRTIIADGRLSSSHPIRTGLIEQNGLIYGAAGVFPESGGVYLFCLDGASGKLKWKQNILVPAIGYLYIEDDTVFVPTGRSSPVEFSLKDGSPLILNRYEPRREGGGSVIWQCGAFLAYGPNEFGILKFRTSKKEDMENKYYRTVNQKIRGNITGITGTRILSDNDLYYLLRSTGLDAVKKDVFEKSLKQSAYEFRKRTDERVVVRKSMVQMKGDRQAEKEISDGTVWTFQVSGTVSLIKTGNTLILGKKDSVIAVDAQTGKQAGSAEMKGTVYELASGGGKLYAGTDEGMVYCFGQPGKEAAAEEKIPLMEMPPDYGVTAEKILRLSPRKNGWCVVAGDDSGIISSLIAMQTQFSLAVICVNNETFSLCDSTLRQNGVRERACLILGGKDHIPFPDAAANLFVLFDDARFSEKEIMRVLHPYEGVAVSAEHERVAVNARGKASPGLGNWTHMFADAANTSCSGDTVIGGEKYRVQWFGAPYAEDDVGWHANGMSPLYRDGRLFGVYVDTLRCIDAYNGTQLWEQDITGSVRFSPGREGGNAFVDESHVYIAFDGDVRAFDIFSGKQTLTMNVPEKTGDWGFIADGGNCVIGSAQDPGATTKGKDRKTDFPKGLWYNYEPVIAVSRSVFACDKKTGNLLWEYRPEHAVILNSSIAVSEDRLFLVENRKADTVKDENGSVFLRYFFNENVNLVSVNLKDGKVLKSVPFQTPAKSIFYVSVRGNRLIMTASFHRGPNADLLEREQKAKRYKDTPLFYEYACYNSETLEKQWNTELETQAVKGTQHNYSAAHPVITDSHIWHISQRTTAFSIALADGKLTQFKNHRDKGCSMAAGSMRAAYYRSMAVAAFDFETGKQVWVSTVNRPSCWLSTIPAGGMIMMPEGSIGCNCAFPIQASIVMVPDGEGGE